VRLLENQRIYARHVLALFIAGAGAPVQDADRNEPGDQSTWTDEQIDLLIDEGRRQLDRQVEDLERVRLRAQVTFVVGLALLGAAGSVRSAISSANEVALWVLWGLALAVTAWAILGAAATAVARADMNMIHATVLSQYTGDVKRQLAHDYAKSAPAGESQVAARLTNLRVAVAYLLLGAALALGAWAWADAASASPNKHSCSSGQSCSAAHRPPAHTKPPPHRGRAHGAAVCGDGSVQARPCLLSVTRVRLLPVSRAQACARVLAGATHGPALDIGSNRRGVPSDAPAHDNLAVYRSGAFGDLSLVDASRAPQLPLRRRIDTRCAPVCAEGRATPRPPARAGTRRGSGPQTDRKITTNGLAKPT
jgi:hypothetical protein